MSKVLKAQVDRGHPNIPIRSGALLDYWQKNGRMPPVSLSTFALEDIRQEIFIDKFISYKFSSSILIPVDSFTIEGAFIPKKGLRKPMEGDIYVLHANGISISTGIVDQVDIETDAQGGSRIYCTGRDLLGQWEDNDAVNLDSKPVWGNQFTIDQVVQALSNGTRLDPKRLIKRLAPARTYLFATQPGESKLSALTRYCEGLDILFWMTGNGSLIMGKPDVYGTGGRKGTLFLKYSSRSSNVISMRSTRNSTQVPNIVVPIWNGQETVQDRIKPEQALYNTAPGPSRLRTYGHRVIKAVVVSTPQGAAPQDLSEINTLDIAKQNQNVTKTSQAGDSNILQAYAKREMARANVNSLRVQIVMAGHYNEDASPFEVDSTYRIQYEHDDIDQDMFLYEVEYSLDIKQGPTTRLFFTIPQSIVAKTRAI